MTIVGSLTAKVAWFDGEKPEARHLSVGCISCGRYRQEFDQA